MPRSEGIKKMRKEIDDSLSSPVPFLSNSGFKGKPQNAGKQKKNKARIATDGDSSKGKNRWSKKRKNQGGSEKSADRTEWKRPRGDNLSYAP